MDTMTQRANTQDIPADTCIAITPAGGVDMVAYRNAIDYRKVE